MRQGFRYTYALSLFLGLAVASAFVPSSQQQQRCRSTVIASTSKTSVLHMASVDHAASDDDSNALNKWSRYVDLHLVISCYPTIRIFIVVVIQGKIYSHQLITSYDFVNNHIVS